MNNMLFLFRKLFVFRAKELFCRMVYSLIHYAILVMADCGCGSMAANILAVQVKLITITV